ncbi:MAG: hypothetical protein V7647_3408 [Acidobacteriota bacterium]
MFRSIAIAILGVALLTGCATRRILSSSAQPGPVLLPKTITPTHGEDAAERVKDAIKSLGHELRRRTAKSPKALADLAPIPLISQADRERPVGTSGVWSVVEATHGRPTGDAVAQTQTRTQYHEVRRGGATRLIGLGLVIAAILLLMAVRLQSGKTRLEHS